MRLAFALLCGAQLPILIWLLGWNFDRGEAAFWCYLLGLSAFVAGWRFYPLHSTGGVSTQEKT
jgi:Fe2+ transport system protein B